MTWKQMEKASLAREREDYLNSTPGQRVEQQLLLSYELTKLASRRLSRK